MNRTLKISFALKNTYRVNSILFSLKQVPLIKKLLPDSLYQVKGLKIFANILSVMGEIIFTFLGKFIYLLLMIDVAAKQYENAAPAALFLHILLFLSLIGAYANTYLLNPGRDKYYAMILMRMNAKDYTLVNYGYAVIKVFVGFLPCTLYFGVLHQLPVWVCILLPLSIAGMKITYAAVTLKIYEKKGKTTSENQLGKFGWMFLALLLAAAYGLPALRIYMPYGISVGIMVLAVFTGIISLRVIWSFGQYHEMYRELLTKSMHQIDETKNLSRKAVQEKISNDTEIASRRSGFEYLNELFIRRHQKILWRSSKRVAAGSLLCVMAVLLLFQLQPDAKEDINKMMMNYLPYFVFVMYMVNRGTGFTNALFMNCDHSLLTYSFYKQPAFILKLFRIRLREIIKINLLPAAVIGGELAAVLFLSGGTEHSLDYLVIIVSILCMSIFFSVHYLTIYYLLQPYNAGTEIKSAAYRIVSTVTYLICFWMINVRMETLLFGGMTIVFCVFYCVVACILVYRVAPKTFRLRN